MQGFPRVAPSKAVLAIAVTAALGLAALVPTLATGQAPPAATVTTITMKGPGGGLRFDGPSTAIAGTELEIVNETKPAQVGPHTFSLVTKGSRPKTRNARKRCFAKNHICRAIGGWHKLGKTKVSEVGAAGWDTIGSVNKKGDSWFTNKADSIVQTLSAAPGTRLFYLCAIHPEMKGSIGVLPAG